MSERKPLPPWAWMILGIIIGLFVAFVWYLDRQLPEKTQAAKTETPKAKTEPQKPKFDFYTILPEMETVVIDPPPKSPASSETSKTPPPALSDSDDVLLQVASFQGQDDAERLRARLALLGLEAHIQTVKVDQQSWHRVRLGPYRGQQAYIEARNRLAENGFEYIQIRSH